MLKFRNKFYLAGLLLILFSSYSALANELKKEIDSVNSVKHDFIVSNTNVSMKIFSENLEKARSIGYKYGEAQALNKLALANYIKGNYEKSTAQTLDAIKLFEQLRKYKDLAYTYGEFGYQQKRLDMNKALHYMRLGIKIAENYNYELLKCSLYDNYGVLKEMEGDLDSANFYYNLALNIKYKVSDYPGIPYSLNKIAQVYVMKGNFSEAFRYLNKSDTFRNKENGHFGRAENLELRGSIYVYQGKIDSAVFYYTKCLELAKSIRYTFLIQHCYQQLTALYEDKKDHKMALENYRNHVAYNNIISNEKTNQRIAELSISYESEKKNKIISENALKLQQKTIQIIGLGLLLILLGIISFLTYSIQKQKREKIRKELELRNNLNKAELENQLRSEKLRISRELHDNIGSHLTFMISSLDNLSYLKENSIVQNKIKSLSAFGRSALSELRNTVWAINVQEGDLRQLVLRINEMVQKLNNDIECTKIVFINHVQNTFKLSSLQMLNIYRIVQEAVQNTMKHAGASEILIELSPLESGFILSVKDNGKGFDTNEDISGNGLSNMKMRCEQAGGNLSITSGGTGTVIDCVFGMQ